MAGEKENRGGAGEGDRRRARGIQEHSGARRGKLPQKRIDLCFGADVDAPSRIEAQQGVRSAARNPACNRDLLLVASRETADLRLCAGVDLESLDDSIPPATLLRLLNGHTSERTRH